MSKSYDLNKIKGFLSVVTLLVGKSAVWDIDFEHKNISICSDIGEIIFSTNQSESGRLKTFSFSISTFKWKPEQEIKLTKT